MSTALNLSEYVPTSSPCPSLSNVIVIVSSPTYFAVAEIGDGSAALNAFLKLLFIIVSSFKAIGFLNFSILTAFVPFVSSTAV